MSGIHQVRVTGILVEGNRILLVKQRVSAERGWSLPGGRVEQGETIEAALVREMKEETALDVKVGELLYLTENTRIDPPLVHVCLSVERIGGALCKPTDIQDSNPITDVKMIEIAELEAHGFTESFRMLAQNGFPDAGSYAGVKENIGL